MSGSQIDQILFSGDDSPERPLTRRDVKQMRGRPKRRRRRRRRGRGVVLVIALALVVGAGFVAYSFVRPVYNSLTADKDFVGPGTGSVHVVVHSGDAGTAIGRTLFASGVIKSVGAFVDATNADPQRAQSIQPGTYTMKKGMRAVDALALLTDSKNRSAPTVTVPEGLWATEIYAKLSKATNTPLADYTAAARDAGALGLPAAAHGRIEGYLFPSTYEFPARATAATQLRLMVQKCVDELNKAGVTPDEMERTLIVASVVEGEVNGAADRGRVARVIENRLKTTGETVGLLQMNSTVAYAIHQRGKVLNSDQDLKNPSPYNTYNHRGLPPGPINNPGAAAIEAAANPTAGPWFFFVTVDPDTGKTLFATTLAEQHRNEGVLQQWCTAHPGKC